MSKKTGSSSKVSCWYSPEYSTACMKDHERAGASWEDACSAGSLKNCENHLLPPCMKYYGTRKTLSLDFPSLENIECAHTTTFRLVMSYRRLHLMTTANFSAHATPLLVCGRWLRSWESVHACPVNFTSYSYVTRRYFCNIVLPKWPFILKNTSACVALREMTCLHSLGVHLSSC